MSVVVTFHISVCPIFKIFIQPLITSFEALWILHINHTEPSFSPCLKSVKFIIAYHQDSIFTCIMVWLSQPNLIVALSSAFSPEHPPFFFPLSKTANTEPSTLKGAYSGSQAPCSLNRDSESHGHCLLQLQKKWESLHSQWEGPRLLLKFEVIKYTS